MAEVESGFRLSFLCLSPARLVVVHPVGQIVRPAAGLAIEFAGRGACRRRHSHWGHRRHSATRADCIHHSASPCVYHLGGCPDSPDSHSNFAELSLSHNQAFAHHVHDLSSSLYPARNPPVKTLARRIPRARSRISGLCACLCPARTTQSPAKCPALSKHQLRSQIFGLYLSCHALVQMGSLPLPAKFRP